MTVKKWQSTWNMKCFYFPSQTQTYFKWNRIFNKNVYIYIIHLYWHQLKEIVLLVVLTYLYFFLCNNLHLFISLLFKGVVDWFFSRLDCVYGVQSSMCSCFVFLKTHYFSHNLPLFHTTLSLLWQTPRLFPVFMKPLPQKYAMGWDWLTGPVCCDSLNRWVHV